MLHTRHGTAFAIISIECVVLTIKQIVRIFGHRFLVAFLSFFPFSDTSGCLLLHHTSNISLTSRSGKIIMPKESMNRFAAIRVLAGNNNCSSKFTQRDCQRTRILGTAHIANIYHSFAFFVVCEQDWILLPESVKTRLNDSAVLLMCEKWKKKTRKKTKRIFAHCWLCDICVSRKPSCLLSHCSRI